MDIFGLLLSLLLITFLIPRQYLGLYTWFYIVLYSIFSFPSSQRYTDKSGADAFGEAILYIITFTIALSIVFKLLITLTIVLINKNKRNNEQPLLESSDSKSINKITFIAYGILSGYYISLFLTNFLENYQPAWEAYIIFIIVTILVFFISQAMNKYSRYARYFWLKNLYLFFSSIWLVMLAVVVSSYSFSISALRETNKIVSKYPDKQVKYCIQPKINTWLDLTPLTTWNKRLGEWGPSTNHAVLVIQNDNVTDLYNWSYKHKQWDYNTRGFQSSSFSSPSSLECVLDRNYSINLPFLFSKSVRLNIGNKKLNIPYKYFPIQEQYSSPKDSRYKKRIKFLVSTFDFSSIKQIFTKLPKNYSVHTDVYLSVVVDNQNLESELNIFPAQKFKEIKSEYGLNKRFFLETEYLKSSIKYYKSQNGFISTVIGCSSDKKARISCQHNFIHDGLIYSFNHSEKDLKNWQKLQTALINKVNSWEIP